MIPRFWKDMPSPKAGVYYTSASKVYCGGVLSYTPEVAVNGRVRAYLVARWNALLLDLHTPCQDIDIHWQLYSRK